MVHSSYFELLPCGFFAAAHKNLYICGRVQFSGTQTRAPLKHECSRTQTPHIQTHVFHILKRRFNQTYLKRKMPLDFKVDNFTFFSPFIFRFSFQTGLLCPLHVLLWKITTFNRDSLVRDNCTKNH